MGGVNEDLDLTVTYKFEEAVFMHTEELSAVRGRFEADGFCIHAEPVIPTGIVHAARDGMDALRAGIYETGVSPQPSYWNPGDDPGKLCKIEMPQVANRAIM